MTRNKYNAQPVVVDGVRFASKAEAARDAEIQLMARAGLVSDVVRQPKFPLVVNDRKVATYVADWKYRERIGSTSVLVVEDKKGIRTPAFNLKWKLAQALYPTVAIWRLS